MKRQDESGSSPRDYATKTVAAIALARSRAAMEHVAPDWQTVQEKAEADFTEKSASLAVDDVVGELWRRLGFQAGAFFGNEFEEYLRDLLRKHLLRAFKDGYTSGALGVYGQSPDPMALMGATIRAILDPEKILDEATQRSDEATQRSTE